MAVIERTFWKSTILLQSPHRNSCGRQSYNLVLCRHPIAGAHIRPYVHVDVGRDGLDAAVHHHHIHDARVIAAGGLRSSFHQLSVFQHTELGGRRWLYQLRHIVPSVQGVPL